MKRLILCMALALTLCACDSTTVRPTIGPPLPSAAVAETVSAPTSEAQTEAAAAPTVLPTTAPTTVPTQPPAATSATVPQTRSETAAFDCDYVLNTSTKKFHLPTCASVKQMKEENRELYFGDRQELLDMGYKPCGNCKP